MRFMARPLGCFFFSCLTTCEPPRAGGGERGLDWRVGTGMLRIPNPNKGQLCTAVREVGGGKGRGAHLRGLAADLAGTSQGAVDLAHSARVKKGKQAMNFTHNITSATP